MNLNERDTDKFISSYFCKPNLSFSNGFECFVERRKEIGSDI
jgi:hypothetical protein